MTSFNYFFTPVGPEYKKKFARNVGIGLVILFAIYGIWVLSVDLSSEPKPELETIPWKDVAEKLPKNKILEHLRTLPEEVKGSSALFLYSEALANKTVSDALKDASYKVYCCSYHSPYSLEQESVRNNPDLLDIEITFFDLKDDKIVVALYNLGQEKISEVQVQNLIRSGMKGAELEYMASFPDYTEFLSKSMSESEYSIVEPTTDVPNPITATNVVDANNQFAFNVYSKISQENDDNIFFSPWSISTAFAIAYEGARGNTAQEIQNAFGFIEDDGKRRTGFQSIMEKSNEKNSEYKFNIANALWLAEGFKPLSQYVSVLQTHYDSEVNTVNFASDATSTINNWISDKTEEKIKELFAPGALRSDTRLVITNAIYFNGSWTFPFDEDDTRQDEFIVSPGETIAVQMMHQTLYFDYYQNEQLQLVELPYLGDKMSMQILLPTNIDGIDSLENSLTAENIAIWKNGMEKRKITVEIPKFVLETDYDLIGILQAMGMQDAFIPAADFSGISAEDLFIYKAIHKAVVDVNEIGTEAAAATGIAMLQSGPFATVRADHPFIFMIQDTENQNILFIGKIADPSQ